MTRSPRQRPGRLARRASVAALLLLVCAASSLLAPDPRVPTGGLTRTANAQGEGALAEEYARLEKEGIEENAFRALCYRMLLPYLPTGTRMTSGYRSPEKQLDLIARFARAKGINVPERMTVDDEGSWRPVFNAVRARGIIIAAPTTTPHGTEEAVFDLSGAGLDAIRAGLKKAEDAGMVQYKRIILEPRNNAVHVEVDFISPKALKVFSSRGGSAAGAGAGSSGGTSSPPRVGAGSAAPSVEDQRRILFQQTQELHDSDPDPLKKIDYDRSLRTMLDPSADAEKIRALDAEMESHQKEAEQQGAESSEKREAIVKVSEALREGRLSDAERDAEEFAANFPGTKEARNMLAKIKVRRLVSDATEKMEVADCESC
ncbi:MAG TPA: hypothetical protein VGV38_05760, partial [Pyrinomonadaceae bacterium]|nr:hypothetical protein [Pyrinomonadaceae bacterium]